MLTHVLDSVLCGAMPCSRWKPTFHVGEEAQHAWRDLALVVEEPKPAVPRVVRFQERHCEDDVSALNEGSHQQMRFEAYDFTEDKMPDELNKRVGSTAASEESTEVEEVERRFFAELCSTPLIKPRSQRTRVSLVDGDGSSYSTHRILQSSWQTNSTDTTTPTKNTFNPNHLTKTQALI